MSELEEVRVFVCLVESQSASKAAEKMGLANSAISRRMKALEERLGVRLLQRTTRRMHLTDDGRHYYHRCRKLLDDWQDAEQEVMQSAESLSGSISISTPLSFGVSHLAPAIADFMLIHPQLVINLDLSDRRVDLVEEGYDLALRIGALEDSTLIARKLTGIRHAAYCSPEFLQKYGPFENPEDLEKVPALCYSNLKSPTRWPYRQDDGEEKIVKVDARMMSSNGEALREAAIKGLGVGCQPTFIVHKALESGALVSVLNDVVWYGMDLNVLYPQTRHMSRKVRVLIDFLVARFGTDPYWDRCLS
jgi:DNA-binding transcriptional LysR family regulator